jgi:L-fucose isomerase-like protein
VVVDSYERLQSRLRALFALKRTMGKRIVAVGGASGWGAGGGQAPEIARKVWKLDIVDYSYADLSKRLEAAQRNAVLRERASYRAEQYLKIPGTRLETKRGFYENAFLLESVLRDILADAGTDAITINACMGTIMPISKTTACMPLSLLNDDGYLAFCESDFVVIPSGILLHYISGKPVFLNDPTFPHDGMVTLAHCTAPRKMNGQRLEPVRILTHFESDYGAAPKVAMRKGQITTNLIPDFACKDWLGFAGTIVANPFLDICRSQIDVRIHGDCDEVVRRMKGFHWMLGYGDDLDEVGYALGKLGIGWRNVSKTS